MNTYRYAAYGSNLHPIRLRRRVPSAKLLGVSHLDGYELRFHKIGMRDGTGKCNIVLGESRVHLAVFEIAESERGLLDQCEGLGRGYERVDITPQGFGICSTYVADKSAIDESRRPLDWYKEMVLLGCRYNVFPEAYVKAIESVSASVDSDRLRARQQWKIVEAIRKGS